jgi:hypothetical protein
MAVHRLADLYEASVAASRRRRLTGGAHHVADEGLELAPIAGMHEDPVVHGEAALPPREEQLDPLLAQQPSSAKKTEHLVTEQLLGRSLVHVR